MRLKSIVLTAFAVIMATACYADDLLSYKVNYCISTDQKNFVIGAVNGASAGDDHETALGTPSSTAVIMAVHKVAGSGGWNGETGFYISEIREPIAPSGSVTVENIYLQNSLLRLTPVCRNNSLSVE